MHVKVTFAKLDNALRTLYFRSCSLFNAFMLVVIYKVDIIQIRNKINISFIIMSMGMYFTGSTDS